MLGPPALHPQVISPYRAAITMISTSALGSASFASTQARAGRFLASTQAVQTSFIGARLRMSVTQMVAESTFDLLDPHLASRRSISSRICLVWPFTSWSTFLATTPARYTVSACWTALERMAVGSCRAMLMVDSSSGLQAGFVVAGDALVALGDRLELGRRDHAVDALERAIAGALVDFGQDRVGRVPPVPKHYP